ncbi:hypothetical protein H0H92_001657 [Tricholoma furcatifolium]|nr:hypothetical protein H0H92_001657 [Tricholoma furcatifolium]
MPYTPISDHHAFFDFDNNEFMMYVKFGDGQYERINKYCTHNPTFNFHYRPAITQKQQGEGMQKAIFDKLVEDYPAVFSHSKSIKGDTNTEWYMIALGTKAKEAREAEKAIMAKLTAYKSLPENGNSQQYITETLATMAKLTAYKSLPENGNSQQYITETLALIKQKLHL